MSSLDLECLDEASCLGLKRASILALTATSSAQAAQDVFQHGADLELYSLRNGAAAATVAEARIKDLLLSACKQVRHGRGRGWAAVGYEGFVRVIYHTPKYVHGKSQGMEGFCV